MGGGGKVSSLKLVSTANGPWSPQDEERERQTHRDRQTHREKMGRGGGAVSNNKFLVSTAWLSDT